LIFVSVEISIIFPSLKPRRYRRDAPQGNERTWGSKTFLKSIYLRVWYTVVHAQTLDTCYENHSSSVQYLSRTGNSHTEFAQTLSSLGGGGCRYLRGYYTTSNNKRFKLLLQKKSTSTPAEIYIYFFSSQILPDAVILSFFVPIINYYRFA